MAKSKTAASACGVTSLFQLLGKAHMLDILYHMNVVVEGQPRRFVDLQKALGISPNTLSERLRELVEVGLLTRTSYNQIPPRVDYQSTAKARALGEAFLPLCEWAGSHDLKPLAAAPAEA